MFVYSLLYEPRVSEVEASKNAGLTRLHGSGLVCIFLQRAGPDGWIHPRIWVLFCGSWGVCCFASFHLQFAAPSSLRGVVKLYLCMYAPPAAYTQHHPLHASNTVVCVNSSARGEAAATVQSQAWGLSSFTTCPGKSRSAISRRRNSFKSNGRESEVSDVVATAAS